MCNEDETLTASGRKGPALIGSYRPKAVSSVSRQWSFENSRNRDRNQYRPLVASYGFAISE